MSLMRCRSCLAKFAVGLLRCPQCQKVSELFARPEHEAEQEENMPKITVGGGASNAAAEQDVAAAQAAEQAAQEALAQARQDAASQLADLNAVADHGPAATEAPDAGTPAESEQAASTPTPKPRKKAAAPPA